MTPFAGTDADVFDAMRPCDGIMGDHLLRAYIAARSGGGDASRAVFEAHNGALAWVPGSAAQRHAAEVVARCDEIVSFLRGRGDNVMGAAE